MSKFHEGSGVRQTPEEGRRTYQPKRHGNNNKDEDNSPKTLNEGSISVMITVTPCVIVEDGNYTFNNEQKGNYTYDNEQDGDYMYKNE